MSGELDERWITCAHEAGHCIAVLALGGILIDVKLYAVVSNGKVRYDGNTQCITPQSQYRQSLVASAGVITEILLGYHTLDDIDMMEYRRDFDSIPPDYIRKVLKHGPEVIRPLLGMIQTVAEVLYERMEMTGQEVKELIADELQEHKLQGLRVR